MARSAAHLGPTVVILLPSSRGLGWGESGYPCGRSGDAGDVGDFDLLLLVTRLVLEAAEVDLHHHHRTDQLIGVEVGGAVAELGHELRNLASTAYGGASVVAGEGGGVCEHHPLSGGDGHADVKVLLLVGVLPRHLADLGAHHLAPLLVGATRHHRLLLGPLRDTYSFHISLFPLCS